MTGAMYAAIGGLKSHMSNLNVIGNNVANVNTYGYKAQRMTFKESIYTTSRSGSNGGTTVGGNNPSQLGYGCSVGSIDLNMSPSTYAPTGYDLDCYIDGEGFFMVGDKDGNILSTSDATGLNLTRVGDFWIDADGYVCNRDGKCLYGFARVQNPDYNPGTNQPIEGQEDTYDGHDTYKEALEAWTLAQQETIISTQLVPLRVPLSAAAPTEANGGIIPAQGDDPDDENYVPETRNWEEGDPVYPYLAAQVTQGKNYKVNKYPEPGDPILGGTGDTAVTVGSRIPPAVDTDPLSVSGVMHLQLKSVSIEKNGAIQGIAANGDTVILGYAAIGSCDANDGVTHLDGPYYTVQGGAGKLRISAMGGILDGKYLGNQEVAEDDQGNPIVPDPADAILNDSSVQLINGGLEASSTDIATEFVGMITTQRGYQANTRIITVTDSMLEELVNMKR